MRAPFAFFAIPLLTVGLAVAPPAHAADYPDRSGADLYRRFCASCHGADAHADGPVARSITVQVPDLTRISLRHGGHFPDHWVYDHWVYRVIDGRETLYAHGPRDMPVWGVEFWREQGADTVAGDKTRRIIDRLVDYLSALQEQRPVGGPPP
jgi:Cytochrome C oxidase, cbb3-type, subunit III